MVDSVHSTFPAVHTHHTRTSVSVEVPYVKLPIAIVVYIAIVKYSVGNSSPIGVMPVSQDHPTRRLRTSTACYVVSHTVQGITIFTNILQGYETVVLVCCISE